MIMKKRIALVVLIATLLVGCKGKEKEAKASVELTKVELEKIGKNPNIAAALLVRKAIIKEMNSEKYTEEQKKQLAEVIENAEIDYFLNLEASKVTTVTDDEVEQVYNANKDKFEKEIKAKKLTKLEILNGLKQQLYFQKRQEEIAKFQNLLVKKYDLNAKIQEYFPELKKQ